MLEECDGSTAVSGYTDASSVLQTTIISDCGANGGEDDSWLMASKHGHLLPIDTDCLDVHEKPSELLERHLACETDSEHVLSSVVNESFLEARDDDQTERTDKEAVRDASASSHESGPKVPTDSYLESLHTRLESTHFRRDEKKEDFIDYLFEKIELLVCEMDGEQETLRDILDDTFEFLEDMSCGRTARRRNASIRASFERFLQSFDKLAAIYPQKSRGRNAINKTDMLDAIVDHFEKINCMGTVSDLVGEVGEFLAPITDATKAATGVVASAARNAAMTCSDTKDDAFSFMSISEETGELPMAHFTQRLPRISEEYSLTSWSSRSRSLRQLKPRQPKLSMQQVQQELNRRNNLKRMRSNIHVHLSKKTVVNKMMEAKETVEDVFEAAGDQLATIFENMEMGIWDMLVLGANSSVDSRHEVATSRSLDFLMSGSIEDESEMNASQSSTRMDDSSIPVPRVFSNSQTNLMDSSEVDETSDDVINDPALIHATSSEDTYASGCGTGHKGPTAKRFQMVDHMKKVRAKASTGRWTPDSNVTGSTCDETVSSEERGSPAEGRRELCSVPSDSVRLERMEMMAYMSIHDRSSVIDSSDSNTHSGRSYRALSLDACATEKITGSTEFSSRSCPRSALITTECTSALSARLEERPGEISFCSRMVDDTPSFEGERSMSIDDGKDLGLGKASNRSNRSVLVSSDDVTSMLIEQVDSIPLLSTSTDASFVTALQSMDLSEQEPPHVVNQSNCYKSQLLKNWSDQSLLSALEDYPDDELHRAGGRKNNARPPSSPSYISKDPYVNPLIVALDDASSSSWAHVMTLILHGTKVGSGWVGKQAMNAMVMVLFVSASTAMAANGALKTKFQERRRQFEDKMMERHSNRSGRAGVTTDE